MTSLSRFLAIPMLAMLACASQAAAPEQKPALRFVEQSEDKDLAKARIHTRFQDMLGAALARQLGRPLDLVPMPRKRMIGTLETGEADVLCGYLPAWLKGDVDWSRPFIPVGLVLVASHRVPAPHAIEDLRGKRIGTVLGFQYPEMEQALGPDFVRDDAPSADLSLRKWQIGRFDYFLGTRIMVDDQIRKGTLPAGYHLLTVKEYQTMCAVAKHGNVSVNEVNAAIDALEKSGELARLLRLR